MLKILAIETCVRVVQAGGILYSVCANIQRFPLSNLPFFLNPPPPHTHTRTFSFYLSDFFLYSSFPFLNSVLSTFCTSVKSVSSFSLNAVFFWFNVCLLCLVT